MEVPEPGYINIDRAPESVAPMHLSIAQGFQWRSDGWGVVGTEWGDSAQSVLTYLRRLRAAAADGDVDEVPEFQHSNPAIRFAIGVIRDLVAIGWQLKVPNTGPVLMRKAPSADLSADAVRAVQLHSRAEQLRQPTYRRFIATMEKRKLGAKGWHSIFSLLRDGRQLASRLGRAGTHELRGIIDPYIQVADPDSYCAQTGLNLYDVWRYFRHTWVTPHQSVPGRSISLLVRDAAAPHHPVIGIAALGSAVVHQTARDALIGWQGDDVINELTSNPCKHYAEWLLDSIERLFNSLYMIDLLSDGTLREIDLRRPDDKLIGSLEKEALRCRERHRRHPNLARVSQTVVDSDGGVDWEQLAVTELYRAKRCRFLATFLRIRKSFIDAGFVSPTPKTLRSALRVGTFRDGVRSLIARIKAERVGIDMMDITVCGAIAPYNHILGGKLVCMLLTSPEVQKIYQDRYANSPSIIASGLLGKEAVRKPQLVCLSTTSLYGRNSSQYNRVSLPLRAVGCNADGKIALVRGGHRDLDNSHRSRGFGTFHFRRATLTALDEWISAEVEQRKDESLRTVNYIFGEGTSPKLRKLRDYIDKVGLPGDDALRHERSRIVYYVALAENVRDHLLGLDAKPRWILPQKQPQLITAKIADYWRQRWLAMRIQSPTVLAEVAKHNLGYPITHGARVTLPGRQDDDDEQLEFE